MNKLDQLILAIAPGAGRRRLQNRALAELIDTQAGYDAAGQGRGNTWTRGSGTSQNQEGKAALTILRDRHRELVRNNPYVATAVDQLTGATIAEGIQPVAKGGRKKQRERAQALMIEWAQSTGIDVDGGFNLYGLQELATRSWCESGEALAVKRIRRVPGVKVPLQVRVLEGDYLDHMRDGVIEGQRVVQGVRFDANLARVGYYLHKNHPGDGYAPGTSIHTSQLITADDIAHVRYVQRPGQVRGIPRGAAAMTRARNLDEFQDARLQQQKIAACLAAFVTQGELGKVAGDPLPNKLEPGLLVRLGEDETVSHSNPPSVTGQAEFVSGEEHMIAKVYGITHAALTGDISGANFSSSKIGRMDMYSTVGRIRSRMVVPLFCNAIGRWFVEAAGIAGEDLEGITWEWIPPRSEILNLRDDIPALIKQARGGLGGLFTILRSLGYADPKSVLLEIQEVNEFLDEHGIVLDSDPRRTTTSGQFQQGAENINDEDDDDEQRQEIDQV